MSDRENNERLAFLSDKIQKVTEAVYRVTDLLSDKEPLKWKIREKSVAIFTDLIALKNKNFLEKNNSFNIIEALIDEVVVLLSLFLANKSITGFNFEILKEEYMAVKKVIAREKQKQDISALFARPATAGVGPDSYGVEKKISLPGPQAKSEEKLKPIRHLNGQKSNGQKMNVRKEKLLNILKEKGRATIGELSGVFTDCSEKTIQRDLLEMVNRGILKKEGDKRWRVYILTPQLRG